MTAPAGEATDPRLTEILRAAGDEWGPLGVALAAAQLTSADVLIQALQVQAPPSDDTSPLPPGRWGRVEMPGYRQHTGWIAEEARFGQAAAVVRDWDGAVVADVFPGPACRVVYLPTPLSRPDPERQAITASSWHGDDDDDPDDDDLGQDGGPF
jgi:hypothetical protein